MQKLVRKVLDQLLFSNLFIGLCAAAQVAFTYEIHSLPPDLKVTGMVFCATLSLYNFSMLLSKPKFPEQSPYRRVRWIFSHQRFFLSLSIIALFGTTALALLLPFEAKILLSLLAVLSLAYNLPLFRFKGKSGGLRNIPGLKILLIAAVWAGSTVLLPLVALAGQGLPNSNWQDMLLLFAQRFLFVMAITIPFDIRDLYQDKDHALITVAVHFGEKKAYQFCLLILIAALMAGWPVYSLPGFLAMGCTTLLAAWLIFRSRGEKNEYYYFLYLDGLLIMPWLSLQLMNFWT